jgi:hypothetical protein
MLETLWSNRIEFLVQKQLQSSDKQMKSKWIWKYIFFIENASKICFKKLNTLWVQIIRDAGKKFRSSESLSHLIAGVFILPDSKTAENRKKIWENDEAQAQKLNQGRIIIKIYYFRQNSNQNWNVFLLLWENR